MVAMKKTLLEIVQDILSSLDSDSVSSITDSEESEQVVDLVIQTYFDLIAHRIIPEHHKLFRLTGVADSTRPTHLLMPADISNLITFKYNKSTDSEVEYQDVQYETPEEFLRRVNGRDSGSADTTTSLSIGGDVEILVFNNKMPSYYTSFDNEYIVCDAHDVTIDTTLQSSKTQCYGEAVPTVTRSDAFIFDFNEKYFPLLQAEAKSRAFASLHKTINAKEEQWAKRHKNFIQKEKYRLGEPERRRHFGRT